MEGRSARGGNPNAPGSRGPGPLLGAPERRCAGVERPGGGGPLKGQRIRESAQDLRSPVVGVGEDRARAADPLKSLPRVVMGTGPPRARPREEPPLESRVGIGSVSLSLNGSPRLQPAALWLTSALASARGVEAGPGGEGPKREGRRAVRTSRGAARLLDPKTTRPAPSLGRRVRTGGYGETGVGTSGRKPRAGVPGRLWAVVRGLQNADLHVWVERP